MGLLFLIKPAGMNVYVLKKKQKKPHSWFKKAMIVTDVWTFYCKTGVNILNASQLYAK